jgi:DNA-binding NtrC family response regulator
MAEILVIDDQDRTTDLCRRMMPEHEWHGPVRTWEAAHSEIRRLGRRLGMVLLDVHFDMPAEGLLGLPDEPSERDIAKAQRNQGIYILEALRRAAPDLPVVLMTAGGDSVLEQASERHGAQEYTYFLDHDALDARTLRAQVSGILQARRGTERDGPVFWGRSVAMRQIRQRLLTLARGRLPVTLNGSTGTGKSLIARHFVHAQSGRKGSFVSVDLSTLPKDLVAAHLFGSLRGAYTGSVSDRPGAFETANGGTLFLDEIGNLPEEVQKMLLSVLQEGRVTRLGDTRERDVDVKLVVATNEDLAECVRAGRFRADLYMRLNPACAVRLPSLVDRKLDLARLLEFAVGQILTAGHLSGQLDELRAQLGLDGGAVEVAIGKPLPEARPGVLVLLFPRRSMDALQKHRWPGNLREFAMVVENAIALALAEAVSAGQVDAERSDVVQVRSKILRDQLRAVMTLEPEREVAGLRIPVRLSAQSGLNKVAQDVERQYFTELYMRHRGDFSGIATVLLGDADASRKVQLRFNQLGLKVRDLKERIQ